MIGALRKTVLNVKTGQTTCSKSILRDAQKNLANNTVSTLSSIQNSWNIPLLVGEFCLYYFTDVWDDFLSDLNEANISWTNWTYKARGTKFESGGGNWGYYNTYTGTDPDLIHDSYDEIKAIWQNTRTESAFSANQPLINTVSARADGSTNYPYVALDRTNWTILATHTSSDPCAKLFSCTSSVCQRPHAFSKRKHGALRNCVSDMLSTSSEMCSLPIFPLNFSRASLIASLSRQSMET